MKIFDNQNLVTSKHRKALAGKSISNGDLPVTSHALPYKDRKSKRQMNCGTVNA